MIIMRNIYLFLTLILFISLSCNRKIIKNTKETKTNTRLTGAFLRKRGIEYKKYFDIYKKIGGYKHDTFMSCLRLGYNRSPEISAILKKEASIDEFPGYYIMNKLDSMIKLTTKKIVEDSILLSRTWMRPDGEFQDQAGNKRVIAHCLELYISPELDSLVNTFNF